LELAFTQGLLSTENWELTAMETRYVWEPDSFAAVLETDDTKLLFRIQTARASISDRIRELSLDGTAIFDPKVFVERPRTTTRLVIQHGTSFSPISFSSA
jgi:hypothetical protein